MFARPAQRFPGATRMEVQTKRIRFDFTTILGCLLCSATFLFWMHALKGGIHLGAIAFFLAVPVVFFCLGDGLLRLLKFPASPAHPFPVSFLLGSVVALLALFFTHLALPLPLRLLDALVALTALLLFVFAPARTGETNGQRESSRTVLAVALTLAAAGFWTQELRPAIHQEGGSSVIHPYVDSVILAEFVGQLHDDSTLLHLGDPDLAGTHLPIYHYASFLLPASLEVWSPQTSAFDATVALWIPFCFVLVGLSAFCLVTEWFGEFAGLLALIAVLLIPSPPLYELPLYYLSFHWLIAVSPGLAYGIGGAAAALVLLSGALRSNRLLLFAAGFGLMAGTMFLKAHIALVSLPLAVAWVITMKQGWTRRTRVTLLLSAAVAGYAVLRIMDHLKLGPNILPNGTHGSFVNMIPSYLGMIHPGYWPHLLMHHVFFTRIGYPVTLGTIAVVSEFGMWFFIWLAVVAWNIAKRRCGSFDVLLLFAVPIYLFCTFISPPNVRGGFADEMWHRPFVWLYLLLAASAGAHLAGLLKKPVESSPRVSTGIVATFAILLLIFPLREGKSIQHWIQIGSLTHGKLDTGFLDCSDYVRIHAGQTDIVQDKVASNYPFLPAFSERRAYLGRLPAYWVESFHGTSAMAESLRRSEALESMRDARTLNDLDAFVKSTGIRWYIARPDEILAWPGSVLDHPVFVSNGFRVYDLESKTTTP